MPELRFLRRHAGGVAAVAAATAGLFFVSRGKWSDAIIDSGREWIVPDALARGGLLYRDVVYWFGPFTPYFQAAFFRVFGSGFESLVLAGAFGAAAALAALWVVLRRVTGRLETALVTALAIPALVFMPNAGGALLGMGYRIWHAAIFALVSVALTSSPRSSRSLWGPALGGAAAGLAGLCRTEWGIATLAAAVAACLIRARDRRRGLRDALATAVAGLVVFAGGLGFFLVRAGAPAVLGDGHVLLTGLPAETRHFLLAFSGLPDWKRGVPELVYSAAMWCGIFLLGSVAALPAGATRRRLLKAAVPLGLLLAASAALGGAGGAVVFSAAPIIGLAGLLAGLARRHGSSAAALTACGTLALSLSYRRPFHIGDSAYVAPPLLFALVCGAGLLRLIAATQRRRAARTRLAAGFRWTIAALTVLAFAARSWQYASLAAAPIAGTSGMLSARPELAREIEALGRAVRVASSPGDGLVVFPEGEILNLLADRANPLRHKLYLPGYLTDDNEAAVLEELERARPAVLVLWNRPTSEYDRAMFGLDYGQRIAAWIDARYVKSPFRAPGDPERAHPRFVVARRKEP